MPRVLTNGEISVGAYTLPDKKRPAICVEEGNTIYVCGYFTDKDRANYFMDKIAEIIGQKGAQE